MSESSTVQDENMTDEVAESETAEDQGKPRRKRRESKGLRDIQHVERHLSKAAYRISRAVTRGLDEYRKEQRGSACAKEDGAFFEMPLNVAKGMAKTTVEMSRVPIDIVKAADTKTNRKLARAGFRIMFFPFAR